MLKLVSVILLGIVIVALYSLNETVFHYGIDFSGKTWTRKYLEAARVLDGKSWTCPGDSMCSEGFLLSITQQSGCTEFVATAKTKVPLDLQSAHFFPWVYQTDIEKQIDQEVFGLYNTNKNFPLEVSIEIAGSCRSLQFDVTLICDRPIASKMDAQKCANKLRSQQLLQEAAQVAQLKQQAVKSAEQERQSAQQQERDRALARQRQEEIDVIEATLRNESVPYISKHTDGPFKTADETLLKKLRMAVWKPLPGKKAIWSAVLSGLNRPVQCQSSGKYILYEVPLNEDESTFLMKPQSHSLCQLSANEVVETIPMERLERFWDHYVLASFGTTNTQGYSVFDLETHKEIFSTGSQSRVYAEGSSIINESFIVSTDPEVLAKFTGKIRSCRPEELAKVDGNSGRMAYTAKQIFDLSKRRVRYENLKCSIEYFE